MHTNAHFSEALNEKQQNGALTNILKFGDKQDWHSPVAICSTLECICAYLVMQFIS